MGKRSVFLKKGDRFGKLVVLQELESKKYIRIFEVICDCGNVINVRMGCLRSGNSKSCGCARESIGKRSYKHGESNGNSRTQLYRRWESMRYRAKYRKNCNVFPEWEDFKVFKEWALSSGYEKDLVLCRNGDIGDYCPDNVRWDTLSSNSIEGNAKYYMVTFPDGHVEEVYNMKEFCKEHKLCRASMSNVNTGKKDQHQGYRCVQIAPTLC